MKRYELLLNEFSKDLSSGSYGIAEKASDILIDFIDSATNLTESEFQGEFFHLSKRILDIQPDMAILYNLVLGGIEAYLKGKSIDKLKNFYVSFKNNLKLSIELIVNQSIKHFSSVRVVGTLSYSSAVKSFILALSRKNPELLLVVSESSPGDEGIRLADEVYKSGVRVLLIPESAWYVFGKRCEIFLIGADAITEKFVINKVGSSILALVAKYEGKPVYVLGSELKVIPSVLLQEKDQKSHTIESWNPIIKSSIPYAAPIFERIPHELITNIFFERGNLTAKILMKRATKLESLAHILAQI